MATTTSSPITITGAHSSPPRDRAKAVKQFEESRAGVKGLVDSGIQTIPSFFVHPPEVLSDLGTRPGSETNIPTVDLSGIEDSPDRRSEVVDQIRRAASTMGFFQIINHGIPLGVLDRTLNSFKAFHEQPTEIKGGLYRSEAGTGVSYISSYELFRSKAASWRDILLIKMEQTPADGSEIPEVCRAQVMQWDLEVKRLGEVLMGLLSEGLGLSLGRLKEMTFTEGRTIAGNYYPFCPQPDLTVGLTSHTDARVLTVLLQDDIGGLQVKSSEGWLDVKPVPGALAINVGDLLQIISNDEYKSADHRVLANSSQKPRISVAVFFGPSAAESVYGPLPELTSAEKPPIYRNFTFNEFMTTFSTKESDLKSLTSYFKL